ncbi:MAG: hypothetical protein H6668_04325 [Ardenticatenaceae bacterium]|nr:hypothetical protein [Ardenticatenaceae bacterium]
MSIRVYLWSFMVEKRPFSPPTSQCVTPKNGRFRQPATDDEGMGKTA